VNTVPGLCSLRSSRWEVRGVVLKPGPWVDADMIVSPARGTTPPGHRQPPTGRVRRRRSLLWTALGLMFGVVLAAAYWAVLPASWHSSAAVVVTGGSGPNGGSLFEINGQAQSAAQTVVSYAESGVVADTVADEFHLPGGSLRGTVQAQLRPGALIIDIRVSATDRTRLVAVTNAIATVTSRQVGQLQTESLGAVHTKVDVVSAASEPVDGHLHALSFILVLGGLLGGGSGACAAAFTQPVTAVRRRNEWDLDGEIRTELAAWWAATRSWTVQFGVGGALGMLLVHAVTGSTIPLILLGLVLAVGAVRDLRWPAVGTLLIGLGAPSPRITLLPLGVVTLSIQDVLILAGIAGVVWRWWNRRQRSDGARVFGSPLLAFTVAIVCGGIVGLVQGADHTELAEPVRVMLLMPAAYLLFRRAFAGRAAQLLLVLLSCAFVSSSLALLAVPFGWTALQAGARDYVVTGSAEASVTRVSDPVLASWSLLLVVLAAGVAWGTRRSLWLLVALPGVALVALSFNRSTWAPLIVIVILAAGLRGGMRGIAQRALVVAVFGSIGMSIALSGTLGTSAQQLGTRAVSAVTGAATKEDSLTDRLAEDKAAVATLEADPYLGTGIGVPYGEYEVNYDSSRDVTVVVPQYFIHNQYFRLWLLLGIPGLAAMMWLLVRLGSAVVQLTRTVGTCRATVPIAAALGLLCIGLQGIFQTNLIDRPTMLLAGISFALIEICMCLRPVPRTAAPSLGRST